MNYEKLVWVIEFFSQKHKIGNIAIVANFGNISILVLRRVCDLFHHTSILKVYLEI